MERRLIQPGWDRLSAAVDEAADRGGLGPICAWVRGQARTSRLPFHSELHVVETTFFAAEAAQALAASGQAVREEAVLLGGLFHDLGHIIGGAAGHEERSREIFLSLFGDAPPLPVDAGLKERLAPVRPLVEECILATELRGQPRSPEARCVRGGDMTQFSLDTYLLRIPLYREELGGGKIPLGKFVANTPPVMEQWLRFSRERPEIDLFTPAVSARAGKGCRLVYELFVFLAERYERLGEEGFAAPFEKLTDALAARPLTGQPLADGSQLALAKELFPA